MVHFFPILATSCRPLVLLSVHSKCGGTNSIENHEARARIQRRYKEAEKISFREKISFQRSGSTAGLPTVFFRVVGKIYLVHFHKTTIKKIALSHSLNCFEICKYFKHIKLFSFYEKGSSYWPVS